MVDARWMAAEFRDATINCYASGIRHVGRIKGDGPRRQCPAREPPRRIRCVFKEAFGAP